MTYSLYHVNTRDVYAKSLYDAVLYAMALNSDGYYISKYHFYTDMDLIAEQCERAYEMRDMKRFNEFRDIMERYRDKAAEQGYLYQT